VTDATRTVTRNLVVQRWGTPQETLGSVNEPREMEENGVSFNEKWAYRNARTEAQPSRERVIYWHRYDFVASFLVDADGRCVREDPTLFLEGLTDRSYPLPDIVARARE
jgi:hypothetical protein